MAARTEGRFLITTDEAGEHKTDIETALCQLEIHQADLARQSATISRISKLIELARALGFKTQGEQNFERHAAEQKRIADDLANAQQATLDKRTAEESAKLTQKS